MIRRALLAFLALPGIVAFAVPLWIGRSAIRAGTFHWLGLLLLLPGSALLVWCAREFLVRGKGTLAPWDPPRHLVAHGAYRVSRNAMYLAVATILAGWAALFASAPLLLYALAVFIASHLRVVFGEEPTLARAFGTEWKQYASRAPRWLFRSRRAVVGTWVAILVILPIAALAYEAYADAVDAREFPAPGTLVDIGGRRLHLLCIGRGEPIVFFEMSGFSNALSFRDARERVAERTMVCSYDRSGMGWSDPADGPVSAGDLARDLAVLQDRAKLNARYVLAASSIGGLTAELFARQFPERVAGLVLLDAANSITLSQRVLLARWIPPAACTAGVIAHFGAIRLIDPFGLYRQTTDAAHRNAAVLYNSRPWMQLCAMARGLPDTVQQFTAAPPLRSDLPLTVLSASSTIDLIPPGLDRFVDVDGLKRELQESHRRVAAWSTRGKWSIVPGSTHLIASSQPNAAADAVLDVLDQVH